MHPKYLPCFVIRVLYLQRLERPEVRGVLKSCVIASRRTDFKRSLSCVDGILLVCVCVCDPLLNNCGAGIKSGAILSANFNSTSFYIAECLILRPIRVHPVLNKTRSTSNGELDYCRRRYFYGRPMMSKCAGKPIEALIRSSATE